MSTNDTSDHSTNKGDLDQLKGIGLRYRAILEQVGVASIKELRHRNAANLKVMIEARHGPVVGLSELQIRTWIDKANAHTDTHPA
ncbi:DUF4332 domain-containing protein [Frankia sp. Cas3]|uniref:DUF4332 domain-containing protein n=1 Tax=Frankia sp. Cas3 TaxID=3073926 RepID=UPI002AD2ACC7|nr:DUF4332 domain-containing protein [Frankia sp. Cas3]